jgi:NAD(P)-dependent dehydrogenase (short-subunit alcohol dehydrogenase family)
VELEGKVALVTGAAGGIGTALVAALDRAGAKVVGVDVDDGDITDPAAVEEIVRRTETEHGALDILVNNAGGYEAPIFPDARSSTGAGPST